MTTGEGCTSVRLTYRQRQALYDWVTGWDDEPHDTLADLHARDVLARAVTVNGQETIRLPRACWERLATSASDYAAMSADLSASRRRSLRTAAERIKDALA